METAIESLKTAPISKRGGARPGAGRKPRMLYEARELFNTAVDKHWESIVQKLITNARNGDKDAIRMVVEHRIGRAPQSIDVRSHDARPTVNLFFNPKVMEAVKIYEEVLKQEITNGTLPTSK